MLFQKFDIIPMFLKQICLSYAPQRTENELNDTQIKAIIAIGKNKEISLSDLSNFINLDIGALSRMITLFVKEGYVIKKKSESDRRKLVLTLSDKGVIIYNETINKIESHLENLLDSLTSDEKNELFNALDVLKKNLKKLR